VLLSPVRKRDANRRSFSKEKAGRRKEYSTKKREEEIYSWREKIKIEPISKERKDVGTLSTEKGGLHLGEGNRHVKGHWTLKRPALQEEGFEKNVRRLKGRREGDCSYHLSG